MFKKAVNKFFAGFLIAGFILASVIFAGFFLDIPKVLAEPTTLIAFDPNALAGDEATFNATTNDVNLNISTLSRGVGITAWPLLHGFSSKDFVTGGSKALAISNNEYYQVVINAKTNYKVSLSSLDVNLRKSSTGPNTYQWQYSLDNFITAGIDVGPQGTLGSADNGAAISQINLSSIANLQDVTSGDTIVFRLYAWGASGAGGTFAIGRLTGDDLVFKGNVNLIIHTLTYTAGSHGSVTGITPQTINHGSDGTEVVAVADSNYHFVNWSDEITTAARTDTNITADISATANFEIDTPPAPSGGGGGGNSIGSSSANQYVAPILPPVVVPRPPAVQLVQPEIQPVPELPAVAPPAVAAPAVASPAVAAPAVISPEIVTEVLPPPAPIQNLIPEEVVVNETPAPPKQTFFAAALSNIVMPVVSAIVNFFKNLKWW